MELPVVSVLRRYGFKAPVHDPVEALLALFSQPLTDRRAANLARDFYHAAALSGQPFVRDGHATFLFFAPHGGPIGLAGPFNEWKPERDPLHRLGKTGLHLLRRPVSLPVPYKFHHHQKWMADPANPNVQPDGYGDFNAWLPLPSAHAQGGRLVSHPDLYSKRLRNRRPITLYLPPGYDQSSARYPTLYVMDGKENLSRGRLPQLFDEAIGTGKLPPFIAVLIPHAGKRRGLEYTPFFKRSRLEAFHAFLAEEVVPLLDKHFRTLPLREARTALGQSFGGTVVATLGLRHPGVFKHIVAQSGVFAWGAIQIAPVFLQRPPADMRFYLDCVDNMSERFQSKQLDRALTTLQIPHVFRAIPSRHEYEDWRMRIVDALRYVWLDIAPPSSAKRTGVQFESSRPD
ncbi:MAG: alpha/beta hydrolase [Myxococcota bacterium]